MNKYSFKKISQKDATLALAKASIISTFRNPTALFFSFVFPFIFIIAFGLLGQGDRTFELAFKEESIKAGPVYDALKNVDVLDLKEDLSNEKITDELKKGRLPAALTIKHNEDGSFDLLLEKSNATPEESTTISIIVDSVADSINNNTSQNLNKIVNISEEEVEGRRYTQIDFILPGQLAFAILASAINGLAFTFISLRKELVIKRLFATPITRGSIITGEIISKSVVAIMQAAIIILAGYFLFNFTLANGFETFVNMLILSMVGLIVFLGFGFFVSSLGKDEESVAPAANLITLPQFILSGAFFPIEAFPSFLQPIAKILPMTFLNDALRKVAFEGAGLETTVPQILGLFVWGVIIYAIAIKIFKWD